MEPRTVASLVITGRQLHVKHRHLLIRVLSCGCVEECRNASCAAATERCGTTTSHQLESVLFIDLFLSVCFCFCSVSILVYWNSLFFTFHLFVLFFTWAWEGDHTTFYAAAVQHPNLTCQKWCFTNLWDSFHTSIPFKKPRNVIGRTFCFSHI